MNFREVFIGISGREYKSVGERMKAYENEGKQRLTPGIPVVITVDGNNFKRYASSFDKPFDGDLGDAMRHAATKLCEEVQNVKIAYSHSDKITLVVVDPNDQMWFNGNAQDIASMVSSIATFHFNDYMKGRPQKPVMFRSKVFQVPKHEIANVLTWKQRDALKTAVDIRALSEHGERATKGKNTSQKVELLALSGFDVARLSTPEFRGFCVVREYVLDPGKERRRTVWGVDDEVPVFSVDKAFVDFMVNGREL